MLLWIHFQQFAQMSKDSKNACLAHTLCYVSAFVCVKNFRGAELHTYSNTVQF